MGVAYETKQEIKEQEVWGKEGGQKDTCDMKVERMFWREERDRPEEGENGNSKTKL